MIYRLIFGIYFTVVFSDAVTVDLNTAVFYQDVHNHLLVMKTGSTCYFWKLQGNDVSAFYRPSSQREMEDHFLKDLQASPQLSPYSPDKLSASFVIVSRCPTSFLVQVPSYSASQQG